MPSSDSERISTELAGMLLNELQREWDLLNWTYFKCRLASPVLRLSDNTSFWGRWNSQHRQIEISTAMVMERSWSFVYEVLKHEVVHQYVDEYLQVDEAPHGPTFRRICDDIGLSTSASGDAESIETAHQADPHLQKLVDRVRKLLALAQSSNRHEAENAAASAQRLMLKYNVELTDSPHRNIEFQAIQLGQPIRRIHEHQSWVAAILSEHFFVRTIWMPVYLPRLGKSAQILEICGTSANISLAAYVHEFLHDSSARLWKHHQEALGIRANRDRLTFLAGVMRGFYDRLHQQTDHLKQEHGLVPKNDKKLEDFFARRFPKARSFSRAKRTRNAAYRHGQKAGNSIVLSKPVETSNLKSRQKMLRA